MPLKKKFKKNKTFFQKRVDFSKIPWYNNKALSDEAKVNNLYVGVFPSGQWGQTVNLLHFCFGGSNPPAPTKEMFDLRIGHLFLFCFSKIFSPATLLGKGVHDRIEICAENDCPQKFC